MATARARARARSRPLQTTIVLSLLGYALVIGTFAGLPIYPELSNATVDLLSHAIAVVNTTATVLLLLGWRWIRNDEVARHRSAMIGAFALIMLFLVLYLFRVGGGGEKAIVGVEGPIYYTYLAMLAIHVVLSILAVPVVLYALVLGLTHTPAELRETSHARVGRVAASVWIVSLVLGVVTYVMLNHIYDYEMMATVVGIVPLI